MIYPTIKMRFLNRSVGVCDCRLGISVSSSSRNLYSAMAKRGAQKTSAQADGSAVHPLYPYLSRLTLFLEEFIWAMLFVGTLGIIYLLYKGPPDHKLRAADVRHSRRYENPHSDR